VEECVEEGKAGYYACLSDPPSLAIANYIILQSNYIILSKLYYPSQGPRRAKKSLTGLEVWGRVLIFSIIKEDNMRTILIGLAWTGAYLTAQALYRLTGLEEFFEMVILWVVLIDWPWQLIVRAFGYDSGYLLISAVPRHDMPLEDEYDRIRYLLVTAIRSTIWLITFPIKAILAIFIWRSIKRAVAG
jgi:hypothetical protein